MVLLLMLVLLLVICDDTHQRFRYRGVSSRVQLLSTGGYVEGSFDAVDEIAGEQWDAVLFYVLLVVFKLRPRFVTEIIELDNLYIPGKFSMQD